MAVGFSSLLNLERPIATGERIIFDKLLTNVGNAYDPKSGNFTCPIVSVFFFVFTADVELISRSHFFSLN